MFVIANQLKFLQAKLPDTNKQISYTYKALIGVCTPINGVSVCAHLCKCVYIYTGNDTDHIDSGSSSHTAATGRLLH